MGLTSPNPLPLLCQRKDVPSSLVLGPHWIKLAQEILLKHLKINDMKRNEVTKLLQVYSTINKENPKAKLFGRVHKDLFLSSKLKRTSK